MFTKKMFSKKTLGQSTAEYLIILVLVSIGSIGIMSVFGTSVRQQLSNVVSAFTGSSEHFNVSENARDAHSRANKKMTMKGIDVRELGEGK